MASAGTRDAHGRVERLAFGGLCLRKQVQNRLPLSCIKLGPEQSSIPLNVLPDDKHCARIDLRHLLSLA
jgi:hypothetical protein